MKIRSNSFEEESEVNRKRVFLVILAVILIMFFNYYLIFVADTFTVVNKAYSESGYVSMNATIPSNIPVGLFLGSRRNNSYTILTIKSNDDYGSCQLRAIGSKRTYLLSFTPVNDTVSIRVNMSELFVVESVKGNITYSYDIYVRSKPYSYLAIVAFIISIVGFSISFYIMFLLIISRAVRRRRRKTIF